MEISLLLVIQRIKLPLQFIPNPKFVLTAAPPFGKIAALNHPNALNFRN